MVEEASAATGVLDLQAQAVAKALEVFKLPPQSGAHGKTAKAARASTGQARLTARSYA